MNVVKINIDTIKKNLKKNKRLMVIILIFFVFLGFIIGGVYANQCDNTSNRDSSKMEFEQIDLSDMKRDGSYYYNSFLTLKMKYDYLQIYLKYFEQVKLSNKSRIRLQTVQNELTSFKNQNYEEEQFYNNNAIALSEKKDETITFYKNKRNYMLDEKKKQNDRLKRIVKSVHSSDYKIAQEKELEQAISNLDSNINILDEKINLIEGASDLLLETNAQKADYMIEKDSKQLNNIIVLFNNTLNEISEDENYNIVYNYRLIDTYYDEHLLTDTVTEEQLLNDVHGKAVIYAESIARLDSKKERFFAIFTVFLLLGIVFSILVGIVYERKKKSN